MTTTKVSLIPAETRTKHRPSSTPPAKVSLIPAEARTEHRPSSTPPAKSSVNLYKHKLDYNRKPGCQTVHYTIYITAVCGVTFIMICLLNPFHSAAHLITLRASQQN